MFKGLITFSAILGFSDLDIDMESKSKYGIDKLDIMLWFMQIIEAKPKHSKKLLNRFKSFLVSKIKRGLTHNEDLSLVEGILQYIRSNEKTNERLQAMKYLFELEFLT